MAEQNTSHARPPQPQQSTSYASPHSYPSPSMNPAYTYPPPQGQPGSEPYRASPTASNAPMGNLNLPPIRAIDGQGPSQSSQQPGPSPMASQLPPPPAPMGGYYAPAQNPSMPPGSHISATSPRHSHVSLAGGGGGGMRYQLPPQPDQRMMSGGRHKKEIKRRTKTGCLTCRKRRIKCDEAHPICRNCQKSKRECAGYDPIFKQQPGPAQIQPAPVSTVTPSAQVQTSSAPAPYSNIPQGYAPAVSSGYPPPINSTTYSTAPQPEQNYDFNSSIDPALAGSDHAQMPYDGQSRPDVKGPFSNNGMYPGADRGFQVKKNRIEDLFAIANMPVPPIPSNHSPPSDLSEVREVYTKDYAPGLDRLLDTTWYTQKGLEYLLSDTETLASFSYLLQLFRISQGTDYNLMRQIPSLEAKTGWQLVSLCRKATSTSTNGTNGSTNPDDLLLQEVEARLDILEHLITGHTKDANPLLHLPYGTLTPDTTKFFETEFWKHLGTFVTLRDDDSSSAKEIEGALAGMRGILHQQENRDVIYSVAIIRHVGTRMNAEFPGGVQQAYGNQQEDDRNKIYIARKFLEDEAQNGMTQVISRVAGMAVRSWHVGR